MAMQSKVGEYAPEFQAEHGQLGTFWTVLCDGCGEDMCAGGDYDSWDDPDYARDMAGPPHGNDHVDLCDDCWFVVSRAYSDVELMALTDPLTEPQGYMAAMAALGYVRHHRAALAPSTPEGGSHDA